MRVEGEWLDNIADKLDWQRTQSDYARLTFDGFESSIACTQVAANNFELKPAFVQMVQQSTQFHGLPDEDPNSHIGWLLEVFDMLKINNVYDDAIRL